MRKVKSFTEKSTNTSDSIFNSILEEREVEWKGEKGDGGTLNKQSEFKWIDGSTSQNKSGVVCEGSIPKRNRWTNK